MGNIDIIGMIDDAMDTALEGDCDKSLELFIEAWKLVPNKDKWLAHCSYTRDFGVTLQCGADEKPFRVDCY